MGSIAESTHVEHAYHGESRNAWSSGPSLPLIPQDREMTNRTSIQRETFLVEAAATLTAAPFSACAAGTTIINLGTIALA
jgi:hypothetical protein